MTTDQFDALAKLLSLRAGPAREVARLVLVDGMRQADAARMMGLSPAAASNALARVRRGLDLTKQVCASPRPPE